MTKRGLSYDNLFPGRFIKAGEFGGKEVTLTIKDVYTDKLEGEDSKTECKAILAFEETEREMVLIKTNAQCLKAMWGEQCDDWIGHKVTLHPENDSSGLSDSGLCIRVKGSPELKRDLRVSIKLPRRRPQNRTLVPTAKAAKPEGDEFAEGVDVQPNECADRGADECKECPNRNEGCADDQGPVE